MEAAIKNYVDFIRGMGIEAWIPGFPGSGPKMSVSDQCRSGILSLNYKGEDVYIRGKSHLATSDGKSSAGFVCKNPDRVRSVKSKTNDEFGRFDGNNLIGKPALPITEDIGANKTSPVAAAVPARRDVATQWSINDTMSPFSPENTGFQYRRIVTEKLTREVRVAKCYVSSLPNLTGSVFAKRSFCHLDKRGMRSDYTGKLWSRLDGNRLRTPEIEKSGLSPGFVRQLIKRFDVYDNVEQPRPSRKTF